MLSFLNDAPLSKGTEPSEYGVNGYSIGFWL